MNNKMIKSLAVGLICVFVIGAFAGCSSKAPASITVETQEYLLGNIGEEYDLSKDLIIEGGNENPALSFTSSDESVAEVSESGVITAKNLGSVTITAASQENKNAFVSVDVLVYPYYGVYSAMKYIDAMGCDIRVRLNINEDGTYQYYRYPMYVDLSGGGDMPELEDSGIYAVSGNKLTFSGEYLNEFSMNLQLSEGNAYLQGDVPTGGASTQMQMLQNSAEDKGESGTYIGQAEADSGKIVSYELTLNSGEYSLKVDADVISKGTYSFENNRIEFSAEEGVSFGADFDAERNVVEGTEMPVDAESTVSVTLQNNK